MGFSLCECCRVYIATNMIGEVKVCRTCFMKLKAFEVRMACIEDKQLADLEAMWLLDGEWVKEGQIYK